MRDEPEPTATKDSLGDRMKRHECASRTVLPHRMPVIIRVDGKAFHTYTRGCDRPFDTALADVMLETAKALCEEIQGAEIAYAQSDEISILVHSYRRFNSGSWFDNQVQKIVSVAASTAAGVFTSLSSRIFNGIGKAAAFDARAFVLPEADVCNYFVWRQQDATRNSIQMLARALYSHKECDTKNCATLQEMCFAKGRNWNDLATRWKRGACVVKSYDAGLRSYWAADLEIPVFSQERSYVEQHLAVEEG